MSTSQRKVGSRIHLVTYVFICVKYTLTHTTSNIVLSCFPTWAPRAHNKFVIYAGCKLTESETVVLLPLGRIKPITLKWFEDVIQNCTPF